MTRVDAVRRQAVKLVSQAVKRVRQKHFGALARARARLVSVYVCAWVDVSVCIRYLSISGVTVAHKTLVMRGNDVPRDVERLVEELEVGHVVAHVRPAGF